jgi:RimJ/RimL family protein N-acetyltransferase
VEIGFTLASERHGSGLATEAVREAIALVFSSTRVGRVVATTDARNTPSIRLLLRLGFVQTDTRRAPFKGEWCDEQTFVAQAMPA